MRQLLSEDQFVNAVADLPLHSIAMMFGAGASRTSGVPLASEIVHDFCLTGYCREFRIAESSRERVSRQEVLAWLELKEWYSKARMNRESTYSAVFKQFKPTYEHQILYIKKLLDGKRPSPAYEALTQLAHEGYFDQLLTTNFDPLFVNCYRARYSYEISLRVAATGPEYVQMNADRDKRQLCYLHALAGSALARSDGCRRSHCVQITKELTRQSQYPTRWVTCARRRPCFRKYQGFLRRTPPSRGAEGAPTLWHQGKHGPFAFQEQYCSARNLHAILNLFWFLDLRKGTGETHIARSPHIRESL